MNKFGIIIISFTLLILAMGAFFLTKPAKPVQIPERDKSSYEYFWGNGCPHCAKVQEFIDSWNKKDTIKITKYEVWYNKDNAQIMQSRYDSCPKNSVGSSIAVPLLITPDGKCFMGDEPIINHLKSI